jgi:hypothetical protein
MRDQHEEGADGGSSRLLSSALAAPFSRSSAGSMMIARRLPSVGRRGQPLLHRADLVDGDVALESVGLAFVALLLVLGGRGQRFEDDDVGWPPFGC